MKKLQKIKLDELAGIDLNERGLCRILGGGTPGNCQCGCLYADHGGSETGDNHDANVAGGHYSITCPTPTLNLRPNCGDLPIKQDNTCWKPYPTLPDICY